ncbi:hypothetical protein ACWGR4_30835 [Embleya sp. NPDC055664]
MAEARTIEKIFAATERELMMADMDLDPAKDRQDGETPAIHIELVRNETYIT